MRNLIFIISTVLVFLCAKSISAQDVQVDLYGHARVTIELSGAITIYCDPPMDQLCCSIVFSEESTNIQIYGIPNNNIVTHYSLQPNTDVLIDRNANKINFFPEN
jgi:hypothetical protein